MILECTVDSAIHFDETGVPSNFIRDLERALTYANPKYHKLVAMGRWAGNTERQIRDYDHGSGEMRIYRGAVETLKDLAQKHGLALRFIDRRVRVSQEFPACKIALRDYQVPAVDAAIIGTQGIIKAKCGCLAGDTLIGINRAGKGGSITIRHLYNSANGNPERMKYLLGFDPSIPTMVRSFDGRRIVLHRVRCVTYSGEKAVWTMRLRNGKGVCATEDHKILCKRDNGTPAWIALKDIHYGMEVACDTPRATSSGRPRQDRRSDPRLCSLWFHPYARIEARKSSSTKGYTKVAELHRLIFEAHLNDVDLGAFVETLRTSKKRSSRFRFVDPSRYAIHHRDGNHFNNDILNLQKMTHEEHGLFHQDYSRFGQGEIEWSVADSIIYRGIEPTYDIVCEEPHRNFAANGIVVHNSGKTTILLALVGRLNQRALIVVHTKALLEQWVERVHAMYGMTAGVIGDGRRSLAPITIAMVQTLARGVDGLKDKFGMVATDECFEPSTPVLMADGSVKPIRSVKIGDVVAVGGIVRHTFSRAWSGTAVSINGWNVTPDHPVAMKHEWACVSSIDGDDIIWYDPNHEKRLQDLRKTYEDRQSCGRMCSLPKSGESSSFRGRHLHQVRSSGEEDSTRLAHDVRLRDQACLECRSRFKRPKDCGDGRQDSRTRGQRGNSRQATCDTKRSDHKREISEELVTRPAESFFTPRGDRSSATKNARYDSFGQDQTLWRTRARERRGAYAVRIRDVALAVSERICFQLHSFNRCVKNIGHSWPLQDRFRSPSSQSGCRDRRRESSGNEKTCRRCEENMLPRVERVASIPLPGAVRLQCRRARYFIGAPRLYEGFVHNLDTEHGVYVAAGVLVHNCHHVSAETWSMVVNQFPAKYRYGVSADQTRKDGMDFIIDDTLGRVLHVIGDVDLQDGGVYMPVMIRVVPTEYDDPLYRMARGGQKDHVGMINTMVEDRERNELILRTILAEHDPSVKRPMLVITDRRAAVAYWAGEMNRHGINTGIMLGGSESKKETERTRIGLIEGTIQAAVGTKNLCAEGLDLPDLARLFILCPVAQHYRQLEQMVGRLKRKVPGKTDAVAIYFFDHKIWPNHLRIIRKHFDRVQVV